jgi:type IV pilus assembly protein PilX
MDTAFPCGQTGTTRRQRGIALVVALVFLLVLTILGVTAVNSSIMQGLMSTSYQQQTVTLSGAENLLLEAEFDIDDIVLNGVAGRDYFIDLAEAPGDSFPATDLGQAWPNDFVVEYMGGFLVPGESVAEGGGLEDSELHIFRVSARRERTEEERGGLRIVQSLYVTLDGPDA